MPNYTTDYAAARRMKLFDAAKRELKRRGFNVNVSDDGMSFDITPIEGSRVNVRGNAPDPALSYENCNHNSETWRSARKSHATPATDAALRTARLSTEAKRATQDAMLRGRCYAEVIKAKSAALATSQRPKPLAVRHG